MDYAPAAERAIDYLESIGMGETPVCIAKTQYSLTDDATKLCKPTGFRITINEVYGSGGRGVRGGQGGGHHDDAGVAEGAGGGGDVDQGERGDRGTVVGLAVAVAGGFAPAGRRSTLVRSDSMMPVPKGSGIVVSCHCRRYLRRT